MLVRPFMYYIDRITQTQLSRIGQKKQSRTSLNRRRRDDDDVCEDAGTTKPNNYFCIYRMSGNIRVSQGFVFVDGEEYQLVIRVTDSDPWGKTENTGSVTLILRDKCKEIRGFYDDAVTFCHNASSVVSGETLVCPSVKCLQPLFNWQKALNASSEALKKDCSFDPQNMEELKQKYSSCIGELLLCVTSGLFTLVFLWVTCSPFTFIRFTHFCPRLKFEGSFYVVSSSFSKRSVFDRPHLYKIPKRAEERSWEQFDSHVTYFTVIRPYGALAIAYTA